MVDDLIIMDLKRKDRRKDTAEVFTPFSLCKIMGDMLSEDMWVDPTKTFLDNSCGNGQIILYIIDRKIDSGSTYLQALSTTYGLDLMQDNVDECKQRIKQLLYSKGIDYDIKKVDKILNENIVCHDALNGWDYENWCPISEHKCAALF